MGVLSDGKRLSVNLDRAAYTGYLVPGRRIEHGGPINTHKLDSSLVGATRPTNEREGRLGVSCVSGPLGRSFISASPQYYGAFFVVREPPLVAPFVWDVNSSGTRNLDKDRAAI